MTKIVVEKVSLNFPLYTRAATSDVNARKPDRDRLIFDKSGGIIGVRAINDLSFELNSGDRLAIIGRNGSGKTTLLQVLAGIIPPDLGIITIEGRTTSLINLNLGVEPEATGHQNITLRGLAAGYTVDAIEAKRQNIVEFSELGQFLDLPVLTYSAGMRMRLSFAIATAFEPEILLLDEWISAGDASFRIRASKRMAEFVGRAGILVLASHNRKMIEENCNRAIWLKDGSIFADGAVKDVLDRYEAEVKPGKKRAERKHVSQKRRNRRKHRAKKSTVTGV